MTGNPSEIDGGKFLGREFRSELARALSQKPIFAAVAYVTDISGLSLERGDTLVCDASFPSAKAGKTTKGALTKFFKDGVNLWSLENLHAKIIVTNKAAYVGSANWSQNSSKKLIEGVLRTDNAVFMQQARDFVTSLTKLSAAKKINFPFLKAMPDPEKISLGDDPKVWLASVKKLPNRYEPEYEKTRETISKTDSRNNIELIRYPLRDQFADKMHTGDSIIIINTDSDGRGPRVYKPSTIAASIWTNNSIWIGYHADAAKSLAWSRFRVRLDRADLLPTLVPRSNRLLTSAQAEIIEKFWG